MDGVLTVSLLEARYVPSVSPRQNASNFQPWYNLERGAGSEASFGAQHQSALPLVLTGDEDHSPCLQAVAARLSGQVQAQTDLDHEETESRPIVSSPRGRKCEGAGEGAMASIPDVDDVSRAPQGARQDAHEPHGSRSDSS